MNGNPLFGQQPNPLLAGGRPRMPWQSMYDVNPYASLLAPDPNAEPTEPRLSVEQERWSDTYNSILGAMSQAQAGARDATNPIENMAAQMRLQEAQRALSAHIMQRPSAGEIDDEAFRQRGQQDANVMMQAIQNRQRLEGQRR